jgi:hypothetical protein
MQRHADPEWADRSAVLREESLLGAECGGNRAGCGGESHLDGIADDLEQDAVVRLDDGAQEGQVPLHGARHRSPVMLPERGAPLDVSEEEGDGAGGKIGHDPIPCMRLVVVLADCRTGAQEPRPKLTESSSTTTPVRRIVSFALGKPNPRRFREPAALADDEVVDQLNIEQLASRTWACLNGTAPRGGRRTPGGERPTSLAA